MGEESKSFRLITDIKCRITRDMIYGSSLIIHSVDSSSRRWKNREPNDADPVNLSISSLPLWGRWWRWNASQGLLAIILVVYACIVLASTSNYSRVLFYDTVLVSFPHELVGWRSSVSNTWCSSIKGCLVIVQCSQHEWRFTNWTSPWVAVDAENFIIKHTEKHGGYFAIALKG